MMKGKEILKRIERGESIVGLHFVPSSYLCMGLADDTMTLKIWGYYPYRIESFGISSGGKIYFNVRIVNKLGTSHQPHNDYMEGEKTIKYKYDKDLEFFETEEEAIHECHLRNRGKAVDNRRHHLDMTKIAESQQKFIKQPYY